MTLSLQCAIFIMNCFRICSANTGNMQYVTLTDSIYL
ncbi:hypothetical protein BH11PSE12_BH11PSE12_03150 [soil metagenome]